MITTPYRMMALLVGISTTAWGCGGRRMELTQTVRPDPVVEWIFDAGTDLDLNWGIFPALEPVRISGGASCEGRLILLCNLGGASESLTSSRAYVLDIETGEVLKSIRGPTRTYWDDWVITSELAYFKREGQWQAFDLQQGRVLKDPPAPSASTLPKSPRLSCEKIEQDKSTGLKRFRCPLDGGRVLLVSSKRFGSIEFELSWDDAAGIEHTRVLCQLLSRPRGGGAYLLVDDERRLVFSWKEYAICVDSRRLMSDTASSSE